MFHFSNFFKPKQKKHIHFLHSFFWLAKFCLPTFPKDAFPSRPPRLRRNRRVIGSEISRWITAKSWLFWSTILWDEFGLPQTFDNIATNRWYKFTRFESKSYCEVFLPSNLTKTKPFVLTGWRDPEDGFYGGTGLVCKVSTGDLSLLVSSSPLKI